MFGYGGTRLTTVFDNQQFIKISFFNLFGPVGLFFTNGPDFFRKTIFNLIILKHSTSGLGFTHAN